MRSIARSIFAGGREIQSAIERMATKDELREVNETLRCIQESIAPHRR